MVSVMVLAEASRVWRVKPRTGHPLVVVTAPLIAATPGPKYTVPFCPLRPASPPVPPAAEQVPVKMGSFRL